ncbi:MAG TPA: hypothetical protein VNB22_16055 [Pyrinomonadaceae bacterium]|jgi:hypothetical protein|nr:hypothetical protein [Pyrinomonadaceae bacterium]
MSKTKYESELYIVTHQQLDKNGKPTGKGIDIITIPVHSFEVEGGANRKINLTSTTEGVVFSEFEQARNYQTLIFYVPPTKDFLGVKLMNLAGANWQPFDFCFTVNVFSNGKVTQYLTLSSRAASIRETPVPVGGTPALLMVKVRIVRPDLMYGHLDPKTKEMINDSM